MWDDITDAEVTLIWTLFYFEILEHLKYVMLNGFTEKQKTF